MPLLGVSYVQSVWKCNSSEIDAEISEYILASILGKWFRHKLVNDFLF
jgi:hypothetical protein